MNRLNTYFKNKSTNSTLNVYITAGFPALDDTLAVMNFLENAGADIIELGIPFSDPLADGPVIQQSSEKSLNNGMSISVLMNQLKHMRNQINVPVILMGYLNPVMQYGLERFIRESSERGIDGFIFPDVPPHEFESNWRPLLKKYNMCFSFLVTPETSMERVKYLDGLSSGFLYAVSSSSTTGRKDNSTSIGQSETYLKSLKEMNLNNPILAGFGIQSQEDYNLVNSWVDGAIVGSAFIRHLENQGLSEESITKFVKQLKP